MADEVASLFIVVFFLSYWILRICASPLHCLFLFLRSKQTLRANGSHCLLEILSASYIFHFNPALRETVGSTQKRNLCFSDACPLHQSLTKKRGSANQQLLLSLAVNSLLQEPFSLPWVQKAQGQQSLKAILCISITETLLTHDFSRPLT